MKYTVLDIFCGAGGFSEGFRQQGFEIIMGIDSWEPAINTFNHNFGLNCTPKNVLDFKDSVEEIESLPDTEVIIGSPPCVSFSSSNRSGKADKSTGVLLTETFLRIVAVKKHKPGSTLKVWLMENVSNSTNYLNDYYTFNDLGLSGWAKEHKLSPNKKAIVLKGNQPVINSAKYGSPQKRKRVISGEFIVKGKLIIPPETHQSLEGDGKLPHFITLGYVKNNLPKPNALRSDDLITDPLYPKIKIRASELSDHFYDSGLYECEWRQSEFLKTNHPYMGRMSFPENEDKPSRTITATKIGTSREAIIYRSEFNRKGNGEYRVPTIRESACLMGFPITYQFLGSEGVKCKLVGNAVCPSVSRAFAKQTRKILGLAVIKEPVLANTANVEGVNNLNTFSEGIFDTPPKRNKGSRFRRHPFKHGNITVTLSNYDVVKNEKKVSKWRTSVQYGNGEGYPIHNLPDGLFNELEHLIQKIDKGNDFLKVINNGFTDKIGNRKSLQEMYEAQQSTGGLLEPTELVEEVGRLIDLLGVEQKDIIQEKQTIFKYKKQVPVTQVFALYAINKISTIANTK